MRKFLYALAVCSLISAAPALAQSTSSPAAGNAGGPAKTSDSGVTVNNFGGHEPGTSGNAASNGNSEDSTNGVGMSANPNPGGMNDPTHSSEMSGGNGGNNAGTSTH